MGIGMKKYIRTIFITAIMAMLCIGFFMYLSNREPSQTATEKDLAKQEVDNLTTIDIEKKSRHPLERHFMFASIAAFFLNW